MTEIAKKEARKKKLVGVVVSDKMDKTIVVEVARRVRHPRYQKVMTKYKKFYAHDENGEAEMGDTVQLVESRPFSKLKRWTLEAVVQKTPAIEKVQG